jgi:hypothetical protein
LHHHSLVRVLADGKGSFGLQEVMDLLVVHLRRKEERNRLEKVLPRTPPVCLEAGEEGSSCWTGKDETGVHLRHQP